MVNSYLHTLAFISVEHGLSLLPRSFRGIPWGAKRGLMMTGQIGYPCRASLGNFFKVVLLHTDDANEHDELIRLVRRKTPSLNSVVIFASVGDLQMTIGSFRQLPPIKTKLLRAEKIQVYGWVNREENSMLLLSIRF